MGDVFSAEKRSQIMRAVRGKNTSTEWIVRKTAFALGYRYRLHVDDLPGNPDLVFPGRNKVIFVHGCFWHQHHCPRGNRRPKSRQDYWEKKLSGNVRRDHKNRRELRRLGWEVLVIWECQTKDVERLAAKLQKFLG